MSTDEARALTVIRIVRERLIADDYDGLFNDALDCACLVDDLAPCASINEDCAAGHRTSCDCGDGHAFHVSRPKEEPR